MDLQVILDNASVTDNGLSVDIPRILRYKMADLDIL